MTYPRGLVGVSAMTQTLDRAALDATMAELAAVMGAGDRLEDGAAELVKVGVDLGTAYTVVVALDEHDRPLAGAAEFADVVRDGVVTDFVGRSTSSGGSRPGSRSGSAAPSPQRTGVPARRAAQRRPAVQHVIESADLECTGLVDEPSAANEVLRLRDGVVVDVGAGRPGWPSSAGARSSTPPTSRPAARI